MTYDHFCYLNKVKSVLIFDFIILYFITDSIRYDTWSLFYLNKVKQVDLSPSVFVFYNFYYFIFHYFNNEIYKRCTISNLKNQMLSRIGRYIIKHYYQEMIICVILGLLVIFLISMLINIKVQKYFELTTCLIQCIQHCITSFLFI